MPLCSWCRNHEMTKHPSSQAKGKPTYKHIHWCRKKASQQRHSHTDRNPNPGLHSCTCATVSALISCSKIITSSVTPLVVTPVMRMSEISPATGLLTHWSSKSIACCFSLLIITRFASRRSCSSRVRVEVQAVFSSKTFCCALRNSSSAVRSLFLGSASCSTR
jgi:hypothetical protein